MTEQGHTSSETSRHLPARYHAREVSLNDVAAPDQDPQQGPMHREVEHLHGPEEVDYGMEELIVLCMVRDGRPYIRSFVEHYFSIGVKHIVFLDNGSTDGTVEALKKYDKVTVLRTGLPFKTYKKQMRQYLVKRFSQGRWSLYVDIDELFDYPYSDVISLDCLLRFLNSKAYTAVVAQMLDMFPEKPLSAKAGNLDEPLKELHKFYDISNLSRRSIKTHKRCPPDNTYGSDEIEAFFGGIRRAVFGYRNFLTKHSLVLSESDVEPFEPGVHWHSNVSVADFTCVLFHYKFLDEHFHKQAAQAVQEEQYRNNSVAYKKYLEVLATNPSLQLKQETAKEIKNTNELVENLFLVVSEDYMMMVYDQERKETDIILQDKLGRPEYEVFDRIRARAKVQSLRAERFKQQIEDLREENRWLIKEHKERVEKLKGSLAREREQNQTFNLIRQAYSTLITQSYKLLKRLYHVGARVLGRKR